MTWNVFRSLKQIDPNLWLPQLFKKSFQKEFTYSYEFIDVLLWRKLNPPSSLPTPEGPSEIDIIIESNEFVWFIESKYKSDISMETTHDSKRNQVIRNIDVGLEYANGKDFYFSLLILDEEHSPKGLYITNEYSHSFDMVKEHLQHRKSVLFKLSGIGVFSWFDLLKLFNDISNSDVNELEIFVARQAATWLENQF